MIYYPVPAFNPGKIFLELIIMCILNVIVLLLMQHIWSCDITWFWVSPLILLVQNFSLTSIQIERSCEFYRSYLTRHSCVKLSWTLFTNMFEMLIRWYLFLDFDLHFDTVFESNCYFSLELALVACPVYCRA